MARFDFRMPDIGEGVTEGEIVAWHVAQGDRVKEDQPMVEIMTDKATVTIGAPKAGTIAHLGAAVGSVAKVGSVIVVIEMEGSVEAAAKPAHHSSPDKSTEKKSEPAATAVGDIKDSLPGSSFFTKPKSTANGNGNGHHAQTAAAPAPATKRHYSEKPLATPATRKLARDLDLDLRYVPPTGAGGRVTKDDVRGFAGGQGGGVATVATSTAPAPRKKIAIEPRDGGPREERRPFVGIRRKIAERMQTSKNTAAHFTFVEECDVTRLKEMLTRLRPDAEAAGAKLTYLPFITKAVVAALKKHPILNSALDETTNELVYRKYYDIGIAASTEQGLMVPVVHDADQRSLLDLAREIDRLGNGARAGTLTSAELSGSTFTITSLGKMGGLFATPILNFPEVGILGVHQIKERPVVRDGQIVIGEVMLLSLSFDHRIVDGHIGAAFAYDVIHYLESPDRLFLEMK